MSVAVIIIGATYFGYFKLAEYLAVRQSNLYEQIFQRADLVNPTEYR